MDGQTSLIPVERIERAILLIRGEKVMLDLDLAVIYGVEDEGFEPGGQAQRFTFSERFHVPAHG